MSDIDVREGGCLCGAVRYLARDVPHHLHVCHCSMCRRISGLATLSVFVPYASLMIEGADHVATYVSSTWASRSFCEVCGAGLWYRLTTDGSVEADYILSAGTLDDLSGMVIDREIHIDSKPDAYALSGDHPRLTEAEFLATLQAGPEE